MKPGGRKMCSFSGLKGAMTSQKNITEDSQDPGNDNTQILTQKMTFSPLLVASASPKMAKALLAIGAGAAAPPANPVTERHGKLFTKQNEN